MPLLIQGGAVIDGTGAAPETQSVFIDQERIAGLGTKADELATQHNDIRVIDASGKTVMPGLIDAHCHITFDEPSSNDELFFHRREGMSALVAAHNIKKVLRAGVTGLFDADCVFDTGIDLRDAIEAGVIEGPRMATGGNVLMTSVGGTAGAFMPERGKLGYANVVPTKDEIISEVRQQIKKGADWIKVHVTGLIPRQKEEGEIQVWSFEELRLVCETAHDLGIPVVGHCRNARSIRDSARAGFDMILHATFMDEKALEAVVDRKVPLVPTFTFQANLADFGDKIGADPGLQEIFRREIIDSSDMLRKAYDHGVPLICGTESGFSLTPYGEWHYRELEVFVKYLGMTPLQAIQCGTEAGAGALGLEGETGAIKDGYLADVIVVDGDPATDVTVLGDKSRLHHVVLGGREIDLAPDEPERKSISGWRVSNYSEQILTRAVANS